MVKKTIRSALYKNISMASSLVELIKCMKRSFQYKSKYCQWSKSYISERPHNNYTIEHISPGHFLYNDEVDEFEQHLSGENVNDKKCEILQTFFPKELALIITDMLSLSFSQTATMLLKFFDIQKVSYGLRVYLHPHETDWKYDEYHYITPDWSKLQDTRNITERRWDVDKFDYGIKVWESYECGKILNDVYQIRLKYKWESRWEDQACREHNRHNRRTYSDDDDDRYDSGGYLSSDIDD
jgi:hypothetical protein